MTGPCTKYTCLLLKWPWKKERPGQSWGLIINSGGNIAAINYCDQRLASLNQDMKTMQLGRDSMVKNLIESIKDLTPVAIYQPE